MCGIVGTLDWSRPGMRDDLLAMLGSLAHRGPDGMRTVDLGPLQLGHARLSILDLSSEADQPMVSADGRFTAIHNGEIYNFLEIRDELRSRGRTFRSESDTEVILEAFAEWGPESVSHFNGIWALAIWDSHDRSLFLSRDRLGVKPLFVWRRGSRFAFASEIKALLRLGGIEAEPFAPAVRDFIIEGLVDHGRETFFAGIERLPAGRNLTVSERNRREHAYWQVPLPSIDARSAPIDVDAERMRGLRAAIVEAIALQLRSDVTVGSCLSGGLDSSTIVAVASALRSGRISTTGGHHERDSPPHLAFFADFPGETFSERRYVDAVAQSTQMEVRIAAPSSDQALASIQAILRAQDEPFVSTSMIAQYFVMRLAARSGVRVLLDGQGADELFGGYPPHVPHRIASLFGTRQFVVQLASELRRPSPSGLARIAWSIATRGDRAPTALRSSRRVRSILSPAVRDADRIPTPPPPSSGTRLGRALWRDVMWASLPSLLRYEDRNSMAFGIEARVPFLDHRLVELAVQLPDRFKIDRGVQKNALRHAFEDIVPHAVISRRDKVGFASPERRWLSDWMPSLQRLSERPRSEQVGLLRNGGLARAIGLWRAGEIDHSVAWRLLNLEMWARVVVLDELLPFAPESWAA